MIQGSKVAIVTGGASGIGQAVVTRLLAAGYQVGAVDIDETRLALEWENHSSVLSVVADVSSREGVTEVVTTVVDIFGPPTVLVNCAGIYRPDQALDISDEDFDALVRINLKGTFLPCQIVARVMARGKGGSIVNITSVAANETTDVNVAYAATKGGVAALTRGLAVSLAPHNIRVNAVAPGPIATPMGDAAAIDPIYRDRMLRRVLKGRFATPDDVAGAVVFLASDDADFITGAILNVDGGVLAHR